MRMSRWMLLGLLTLVPWNSAARADDYDANLCEAFAHNSDSPFDVPTGGQYRLTIDMRHCGGLVQNYQVTLFGMGPRRDRPYATLTVLDQNGNSVGVCDKAHRLVYLGNVPTDAVYTVVVTSGSRDKETCSLYFTGAI
jgi:hypothetical protein